MQSKLDKIDVSYKPWLSALILLLADIISITISFLLAFLIRTKLIPVLGGETNLRVLVPLWLMLLVIIIGSFAFSRLYPGGGRTGVVELRELFSIITLAFIIIGLAVFIFRYATAFSRLIFFISWLFCVILLPIFRIFLHNRGSLNAWWNKPVIVMGTFEESAKVVEYLRNARRMAFKPSVMLLIGSAPQEHLIDDLPILPYSRENLSQLRQKNIKTIFFASGNFGLKQTDLDMLNEISLIFPEFVYVMGESPLGSLQMKVFDLEGLPSLTVKHNLLNPRIQAIKRMIDLVVCILSSIVTLPIFLILVLAIKLDSPGPAIYVQKRLGRGGKIFDIYKFRTMYLGAESTLQEILDNNELLLSEYKTFHKLKNDPRITRMGKFLRKFSLDEFPQLWNVLKGEMSLIGPRAYIPEELGDMGERATIIHRVSPGLTGWWQVMGRHEKTFAERLRMDVYYISNFSLWLDIFIMIKTFWVLFMGKGA